MHQPGAGARRTPAASTDRCRRMRFKRHDSLKCNVPTTELGAESLELLLRPKSATCRHAPNAAQ